MEGSQGPFGEAGSLWLRGGTNRLAFCLGQSLFQCLESPFLGNLSDPSRTAGPLATEPRQRDGGRRVGVPSGRRVTSPENTDDTTLTLAVTPDLLTREREV